MKKSLKRFGWPVLLLFVVGVVGYGYALWLREPVYENRELSAWLEQLADLGEEGPSVEADPVRRCAWEIPHEKAVGAVRSIGAEALPYLLRWLRSAPKPSPWCEKLQDLLDKQSVVNIKLRWGRDRTDEAIRGFRALGAAAAPALPELRRLLQRPAFCYHAVLALEAIGPCAFPILALELTNSNCPAQYAVVESLVHLAPSVGPSIVPVLVAGVTNPGCRVPMDALIALGNLGSGAREIAPWLASLTREPGQPLSGFALRVLAKVSDRPEQFLPLFSDHLTNANWAGHAAFALADLGPDGIPPLLRALTNQEPRIRSAALAALNPEFKKRHLTSTSTSSSYRFSTWSSFFDSEFHRCLHAQATAKRQDMELYTEVSHVASVLDHPDATVRLQTVQLLTRYGRHGGVGLSHAAADPDERVRTEAQGALANLSVTVRAGALLRGPTDQKKIALIFAGHTYAEGFESILNELGRHKALASFFLTDTCLSNRQFRPLVRRLDREDHYMGPHSDKLLVDMSSEKPKQTLVTRKQFSEDFFKNLRQTAWAPGRPLYFLPHDGHSNLEIAEWAAECSYTTISYTPGTLSTADDTRETDPNFVPSQAIFDSIIAKEQQDPHGLNGCMLLLHLGSGPGRADKFHTRLGELLDYLTGKGYQFVTVDELIDPQAAQERRRQMAQNREAIEAFRKRYGLDVE